MKIYCFYGIGKPTERAYYYKHDPLPGAKSNVSIDTTAMFEDSKVDHGVILGEGDGTVNLLSSAYMCAKGWKMKRYNPSGIKVTSYEMPHEPDRFSPRGGPNTGKSYTDRYIIILCTWLIFTGDHVDILGRSSLNDLILKVAGGKGDTIEDTFFSDIHHYAEKVRIWDDNEEVNPKEVLEKLVERYVDEEKQVEKEMKEKVEEKEPREDMEEKEVEKEVEDEEPRDEQPSAE